MSSHLCHIQAASEAVAVGLALESIKPLGRWKSNAMVMICFCFFPVDVKNVWVLGQSFVYWEPKRAKWKPYGPEK